MPHSIKPKTFYYSASVTWKDQARGTLQSEGKPELQVSSPPEFKGHPGVWTPEHLLVAAVNACTMTTFLSYAARQDIPVVSYDSDATGTLEMLDGKFQFSRIVLWPRITVVRAEDQERALAAFRKAEENCLVANSLKGKIEGQPQISLWEQVDLQAITNGKEMVK